MASTSTLKAFKSLHFSPGDTPERRAALLNGLLGEIRSQSDMLVKIIGSATYVPVPASSVVTEQAFGQAADAGGSKQFSRGDHTHGTPEFEIPDGFVTEEMVDDTIATAEDVRRLSELTQELRLLLHDLVRIEMGQAPETGLVG